MMLGQVIALDLTVEQAKACARAAGVARFTYNWALNEWGSWYRVGKKPTASKLKKYFNSIKEDQFPWIYDSPRDANSEAFSDLGTAFFNFFSSLKGTRKGPKVGYPTERKKWQDDCFYVANDKFHFDPDGQHVYLPVIGKVRIHESLRFTGKIMSGRVRRKAGRWYLSVNVECGEVHRPVEETRRPIVGADLGLKVAVATSDGKSKRAPKPLRRMLNKLRRASRKLSRRVRGSNNRKRARAELARVHEQIANIRKDFMHKITTELCRENQAIVIEDLNISGMLKNHKLARAISDVGFGMFRQFLTYKSKIYGTELILADRWFPSSKRCSGCGAVKEELGLDERLYCCSDCGLILDRDLNAAKNLEQYPRLEGNWGQEARIAHGEETSTDKSLRLSASILAEVGTNPCSLVNTY